MNGTDTAGDTFPVTQRTKLKRLAKRAVYDRATVYSILDDTFVCHVGYTFEGQQFVMPQAFALDKQNEKLYFHGSITSRMLKTMKVMVFGRATEVTDQDEKLHALDAVVEHICPGRTKDLQGKREPTQAEMNATTVLALDMEEVSAKVRTGDPNDDKRDLDLPVWAGTLPMQQTAGSPQAAADLRDGIPVPHYLTYYQRPAAGL